MKRWCLAAVLGLALALGLSVAGGAEEKKPGTGPWDLKALQKAPEWKAESSEEVTEKTQFGEKAVTLTKLYYKGEDLMGKPTRVFAYYARPTVPAEKKLPAMVLVHGGGGTAFPQWARLWASRGYAAIAMDLAGKGPDGKRLPDGGPDQGDDWKFLHLKDGIKNVWPYYAVAAVIRAHSLLRAFPEVDKSRIGLTGISWGGYLTTIVMSLDDRFKCAVPVYGCGYLHENSVWLPTLNAMPADERRTWVENFDPSSYLPRCKMPVLWMNGTNDFAYPLDSYQKCYRAMKGPKILCITVNMPHGHEAGWARQEIDLFTDSIFRREDLARGLAQVSRPLIMGEKVRVATVSESAIRKAEIHWTTDLDQPWQKRRWQTAPGRVIGLDEVEAPLPKERPCVLFVTVTDIRDAVVSTEHIELK